MMTTDEEANEVYEKALNHFEPEPEQGTGQAIDVCISLQALSSGTSFQTLLIEGKCKKQSITIIINLGSTHNFLARSQCS